MNDKTIWPLILGRVPALPEKRFLISFTSAASDMK